MRSLLVYSLRLKVDEMTSQPELLTQLAELILKPKGLKLTPHGTENAQSQLSAVLKKHGAESFDELMPILRLCEDNSALHMDLLDRLIDTRSAFFTPYPTYKLLRNTVIPQLMKSRAHTKRLTIVSAGCGAGQELFSLMILVDMAMPALTGWDIEYVGFDISERQIERARLGIYGSHELKGDVPDKIRQKYFTQESKVWKLTSEIVDRAEFFQADLLAEPDIIEEADLLFCRNVLDQLTVTNQRKTTQLLAEKIRGQATIVLGPKEVVVQTKPSLHKLTASSYCYSTKDQKSAKGDSPIAVNQEEQEILCSVLGSSELFGDLPRKLIEKISSRFELHELAAGSILMTQGKPNEAFFIIYEGTVPVTLQRSIFQKDLVLARLGPGDCCGEMSLIMDEPCSASVIADEPIKVFAASRALFDFLRKNHEGFNDYIVTLHRARRKSTEERQRSPQALPIKTDIPPELEPFQLSGKLVERLIQRSGVQLPINKDEFKRLTSIVRKMTLFQDMEVGKIESFVQLMQYWRFPEEAVIVKAKDEGLGLYVVDQGELIVNKGSGFLRKGEDVASLKSGQIFGELSILTFTPSNAHVIAKGPVTLFIMGRELFRHLADGSSSFYNSINEVAKNRR